MENRPSPGGHFFALFRTFGGGGAVAGGGQGGGCLGFGAGRLVDLEVHAAQEGMVWLWETTGARTT